MVDTSHFTKRPRIDDFDQHDCDFQEADKGWFADACAIFMLAGSKRNCVAVLPSAGPRMQTARAKHGEFPDAQIVFF